MDILAAAQAEFTAIISKRKIMIALTRGIPPTTDKAYKSGEMVLVYFEKEKKWPEPIIVVDGIGRMITVQILNGSKRQNINDFQIKLYYGGLNLNLHLFQTGHGRRNSSQICLTEVIHPNGFRTGKFNKAKLNELEGLIKKHGNCMSRRYSNKFKYFE